MTKQHLYIVRLTVSRRHGGEIRIVTTQAADRNDAMNHALYRARLVDVLSYEVL
jgi:hypothetical protein